MADLSRVSFLDAAGLSVFVVVDKALRDRDGRLVLQGATALPARVLRLGGLDQLLVQG